MASYTEQQRIELIKNEKAFQKIRRTQIEGMYKCIQAFNITRIVILICIIILIINNTLKYW